MEPRSLAETMFDLQLAIDNCAAANPVNMEWMLKHKASLRELCEMLPSGSGIDNGTTLVEIRTARGRESIDLSCSFHHMNDLGVYDGWTEHKIRIRPSFHGLDVSVSGPNRNRIKDDLQETYDQTMRTRVRFDLVTNRWISEHDHPHTSVSEKLR